MTKRIVIIGAVALGPKVSCRIKRLIPEAAVTMIDKDRLISYGGCGIPYYVSGDVPELEGLYSTSAHIIRDADFFQKAKGVDLLTRTEAVAIDRKARTVTIRGLDNGRERSLPYDHLVLATGAQPVVPPIPGADLPGVTVVANLSHAKAIKDRVASGSVGRAVVIGGGAIGIEMAEALTDLWGIDTTLVEMKSQLLPTALGPDLAAVVDSHLRQKGVRTLLGHSVAGISPTDVPGRLSVDTSAGRLPCDLVVLAVGVRPNSGLARSAGLDIGTTGGIRVNRYMQTSDPFIYAGGDCAELRNLVSGDPVHMPLGSLANRQGRVIANHMAGQPSEFRGTVGTFCIKVFDMGIAKAGLTADQARKAGFAPVCTVVAQPDRAHFYPSQEMMLMKLIADRHTRQVLGVEAIGPNPDAVKARVDAVAVCLPSKPVLEDISNLEVAYSPPFASAMDIVNSAANALENTIDGRHRLADPVAFMTNFKTNGARVLDVRSKQQAGPFRARYGDRWQNIPQEDLSSRIGEIPSDGSLYLVCGVGSRAYEAQVLLRRHGITNTRNIQGGMKMLTSLDPEFEPSENSKMAQAAGEG